jgi:hypothetical protein
MEYQIQANTRRCVVSGRELHVGDRFYSALSHEDGRLVRRDYGEESWQGPPPGAFSFWSGRIPEEESDRRPPIDDDLLLGFLERLASESEPAQVQFRYVVALLLMRRRRLRLQDAKTNDGREMLILRSVRNGQMYQVVNPCLDETQMQVVQDEVFRVLGWD